MFRVCLLSGYLSSLVWFSLAVSPAAADDRSQVAGKSVDEYAAQVNHDNRVIRLRAVRSLGAFGQPASDVLAQALDHEDAAVRYIAAAHLGRIGGSGLKRAIDRLTELAADESSLAVQVAAAYALCRAGRVDKHLPMLIKTLQYPERGMVCSTAELIGGIGPPAAAAIEPLEQLHEKNRAGVQGGDYHIGGAAMNALRKIRTQQD